LIYSSDKVSDKQISAFLKENKNQGVMAKDSKFDIVLINKYILQD